MSLWIFNYLLMQGAISWWIQGGAKEARARQQFLIMVVAVISTNWTYDGILGPATWDIHFPLCGGRNQSPIDISTNSTVPVSDYVTPLIISNYNHFPLKMFLANTGHTAQVSAEWHVQPFIKGSILKGNYNFAQLHFHWGSHNGEGSEHTLNGQRYPMEMHFVHYSDEFCDVAEAALHPQGLVVLAVFMELSQFDNVHLNNILKHFDGITEASSASNITTYPMWFLLPYAKEFYTYNGSLTTPECNEVVTWIVFKNSVKVSSVQIEKFRELNDADGHKLRQNFRPLQQLNERKIYFSRGK